MINSFNPSSFLKKAKLLIDKHAIISFDIFDTLLVRPYLRPTDLFVHLEKLNQLPGFEKRRRAAERAAHHKHPDWEDITLDEIYAELSGSDATLKNQELELEHQTLVPNPIALSLFNYAKKQGKKIIIVSDMYLPASFLEQVLQEKGFVGFEKLYVSNDSRKQKGSGKLYHYVQQELQVNPKTILHIGDNRRSDGRRARKAGWHALHCPSAQEIYFKKFPRIQKFWEQYPSFESSIVIGTLILHQIVTPPHNYFFDLGYQIGGPAAYGFTRWIERQVSLEKIPNLFFVARDGYVLNEVFKTFANTTVRANYIYALRFLNNICRLDYRPTSLSQMRTILQHFAQKSPQLQKTLPPSNTSKKELHLFIEQHLSLLAPLAQQELAQYRNYLSAYYKPDQQVGVVDSVTSFFSSQKLVEAVVGNKNVTGFYWAVTNSSEAQTHSFKTFLSMKPQVRHSDIFTHCWPFVEFLFTAPEPPIKNMSGDKPVYDSYIPPEEQARIAAYKSLAEGILCFANDLKRIFYGRDVFLTGEFLTCWINWFLLHPTQEDKQEMAKIFHASGSDHKEYEPLLSFRPSIRTICTHFKQHITFAKQVYWKTPFQFILTCFLSPVASERISSNERALYLFPRLRKQFGRIQLRVGRYIWTLIWGRRGD